MARRYGWLLLALAACGDGEGAKATGARGDGAAAPAAAPARLTAPPVTVEGGRFTSDVRGLPVASPGGRARFCAGGAIGTGFGLVLSTDDKYAIHLYRLGGRPVAGLYQVLPMTQNPENFATADGFFLSAADGSAVPLAVMPGSQLLVESADSAGVAGTVRLEMRTHRLSGDDVNDRPASAENPKGFSPNEALGTVTASFRAVDGGACSAIQAELMADIPEALRPPAQK